mgnify:CR=1 FL=1
MLNAALGVLRWQMPAASVLAESSLAGDDPLQMNEPEKLEYGMELSKTVSNVLPQVVNTAKKMACRIKQQRSKQIQKASLNPTPLMSSSQPAL